MDSYINLVFTLFMATPIKLQERIQIQAITNMMAMMMTIPNESITSQAINTQLANIANMHLIKHMEMAIIIKFIKIYEVLKLSAFFKLQYFLRCL